MIELVIILDKRHANDPDSKTVIYSIETALEAKTILEQYPNALDHYFEIGFNEYMYIESALEHLDEIKQENI